MYLDQVSISLSPRLIIHSLGFWRLPLHYSRHITYPSVVPTLLSACHRVLSDNFSSYHEGDDAANGSTTLRILPLWQPHSSTPGSVSLTFPCIETSHPVSTKRALHCSTLALLAPSITLRLTESSKRQSREKASAIVC